MTTRSCRRFTAAAAFIVSLGSLAALLASCAPEPPQRVEIGKRLPPFELPDLSGTTVVSDDLAGERPVLINFWATWCAPCVREIPALQDLYAGGGVRVVSINVDSEESAEVQDFVHSHGIEYEVLRGEIGTLADYGSESIPYTLILDGDLIVRSIHRVTVSRSTLERDLSAAK